MRRENEAIDDRPRVERLLRDAPVGRIATVGAEGPMVKPVNYLWRDGAVWIHSALAGEKVDQMKVDPRVCFQVEGELAYLPATDDPCDASFAYLSVIATGSATFVEDAPTKLSILDGLMKKYQPEGGYRPLTEAMAASVALIRIDIDRLTAKASPAPARRG